MKILCFYNDYFEKDCEIKNQEKYNILHSRYLLNLIFWSDKDDIDYFLESIEEVEKGKKEVFEIGLVIPDIYIYIYKEKVLFEHNLGWYANWECQLKIVKEALRGWKKFLEMPKEKDTVYEFEINDLDL